MLFHMEHYIYLINDLLLTIQSLDAEIPYAEYTKQEFDKYLNSIIYEDDYQVGVIDYDK